MVEGAEGLSLEAAPCPLGCTSGDRTILVGRDLIHRLPGTYRVVRCRGCGLMRTTPRPTSQSIGFYYPDDYAPYLTTRVSNPVPPVLGPVPRPSLLQRIAEIVRDTPARYLPDLAPGALLEIGCASGAFLNQMKSAGWRVTGLELSGEAVLNARQEGLEVFQGRADEELPPLPVFDLITAWNTLEHLHDPIQALRSLRLHAHPRTWLVLSVPDSNSWEFRIFRHRWYALQLPTHLFHFTTVTLRRVLAGGGWNLRRVFWHRNPKNFLYSLHYLLSERGWNGPARWLKEVGDNFRVRKLRMLLGFMLGLFHESGRMTVWAQPDRNG